MGSNASSFFDSQQIKCEKAVNICCADQRDELKEARGRIQHIPQKKVRKKKPNPWISPPPLYQPQDADRLHEDAYRVQENYCDCMPNISAAEDNNLLVSISAEPKKLKSRKVSFRRWNAEALEHRSSVTSSFDVSAPQHDPSTDSTEARSWSEDSPEAQGKPGFSPPSWKLRPVQLRDGTLTFEICDASFQKHTRAPKMRSMPAGWSEWEIDKLEEAVDATAQAYGMQPPKMSEIQARSSPPILLIPAYPHPLAPPRVIAVDEAASSCAGRDCTRKRGGCRPAAFPTMIGKACRPFPIG
jgi:hypothetical protein